MKARDIIMSTTLGAVLQQILEQNVQEVTKAYLSDYVNMVYAVKTTEEHQVNL